KGKANPVLQTIMCFGSGLTAGLFGINLLFLIYLERTSKNREEFRGSICLVFLLENIFRAFMYTFNHIFTPFTLKMSLITVPAALIGMFVGLQIDKHIDESRIKKLVVYVFIIGGISTVVRALILKA
ncbi:MAG: sulfite exporter TauE/SafE family protein, partial [Eubacterium sp.]|nr:sulfite exporter TauE/SafE family protein [Eubacterium sp.]